MIFIKSILEITKIILGAILSVMLLFGISIVLMQLDILLNI